MATTIAVTQAVKTLKDAHELFDLRKADADFFTEWQNDLPELSNLEKAELTRLKNRYLYYLESGEISEGTANFIMLSPLLNALGLCDPPYRISGEQWTRLSLQTDDEQGPTLVEGRMDALVLQDDIWLVVVEGKRGGFNVLQAIPQTIAYMMASPKFDGVTPSAERRPLFGLATNGYDFLFLKLQLGEPNRYALSHNFTLLSDQANNLVRVGQILRKLASIS
ncbi:MAG: type I restriction endonuclease subunit R [Cyanobacteria bacterium J06598_1]